jgi:hypothetical protein
MGHPLAREAHLHDNQTVEHKVVADGVLIRIKHNPQAGREMKAHHP